MEGRRGVVFSRSRDWMWRKGQESGHHAKVKAIALDCDKDCALISVRQIGGAACHTGRKFCFFHPVTDKNTLDIRGELLLFDTAKVYKK